LSSVVLMADRTDAQSSRGPGQDSHAGHAEAPPAEGTQSPPTPGGGAGHQHSSDDELSPQLPAFIPPVTDEDRKAAFPDVRGHAVHDRAVNYFVLFDGLEWQSASEGAAFNVDTEGWIGRDRDRLWVRAQADAMDGDVGHAQAHMLYGRQISRWWDVVGGVSQDFRPAPGGTWAAVGVQGLAPYWFEVQATAYVGASGRTRARLEVEYELLLTNRLIVQPLVEVEIVGKSDPARGVGAGVSTTEAGFRVRYELRREIAPYVGLVWSTKWGRTADLARAAGEDTAAARFVTGLRLWF
jgi:copper resistance protein B